MTAILAESAASPSQAYPKVEETTAIDWSMAAVGVSAAVVIVAAGVMIWKKTALTNNV